MAERTFRRSNGLLSASVDDEIVMMSVDAGQYYNLNAMGAQIWRLLKTPKTVDQIVAILAETYDASDATIRIEVGAFLDRMEREGALEMTGEAQA